MFDEGSPKESHRLTVAVAVVAGIVMVLAAFGAEVVYRTGGHEIVLTDGAVLAQLLAPLVAVALVAWHRGALAGTWPLVVGVVVSALTVVFLAGDLLTAWEGRDGELRVAGWFWVTLAASSVLTLACAASLWMPVVEQSGSRGNWRPRDAKEP